MNRPEDAHVAVIGLGYVGLPLALAFAKHYPTVGFDIDSVRVKEIADGRDRTHETSPVSFSEANQFSATADPKALADCNVYIVTVPTPVDGHNNPDLSAIEAATRTVAAALKKGDVVVYESTVYPGVTEEHCGPMLAKLSGLTQDRDFFLGYSPERVNPGDANHRLQEITKVTSGSTPEAADFVDALYARVITAGTFRAKSIKVAEAAKVIENTQRDVNIALVNEFAELFHLLGLEYSDVLAAARTKWNFLPFEPGLVGGHCIGVDPYYLAHKARGVGYHPQLIEAARRVNDRFGRYVAGRVVRAMSARGTASRGAHVLVMGLTFKENCPDLRNTRVVDLIDELKGFGAEVTVHDPEADAAAAQAEYGIDLATELEGNNYDAIVVAVRHQAFVDRGAEAVTAHLKPGGLLVDLRNTFPAVEGALRL